MSEPLPLTDKNLAMVAAERRQKTARAYRDIYDMGNGLGFGVFPENRLDPLKGVKRVSYSDHLDHYYKNQSRLDFDPGAFAKWDAHIKDYLDDFGGNNAFYNPDHKFYEHYEPVRQNVSLLRNILYNEFFPDGVFNLKDDHDKDRAAVMEQMGKKIGHILKWRAFWSNVLPGTGTDKATKKFGEFGEEHLGAAELYKALLKKQDAFSWNPLNWIQGKFYPNKGWKLPPTEETPFSQTDMVLAKFIEEEEDRLGLENAGPALAAKALNLEGAAVSLLRPQEMPVGDVRHSVDLGHAIIDNLKKMNLGASDRGLDARASERRDLEEGQAYVELASAYQGVLAGLARSRPDMLSHPLLEQARLAIGKLGHITLINAMDAYAHDKSSIDKLNELIAAKNALPLEFQEIEGVSKKQLVKTIEEALNFAMEYQGIRVARSPQGVQLTPEAQTRVEHSISSMRDTMADVAIGAASLNLLREAKAINQLNESRRQQPLPQSGLQQSFQRV